MLDVIPSSGSSYPSRPRRSRRRRSAVSPNVVQVEWKLPARLRKPVRQQLAQERAQKRRRAAVVQFQRRPLHTQALLTADQDSRRVGNRVHKPTRRFFGSAVPSQTQDISQNVRPQLQLAPPPYVGSFAAARPSRKKVTPPQIPAARPKKSFSYASGERDVPIVIGDGAGVQNTSDQDLFVQVGAPKKNVAAGVTFSLWPGKWFKSRQAAKQTSKKKLISQY